MKGYKVFNPNWTCRGFQFGVGQTYEIEGELRLCRNGFHFCTKASDCFKYYDFDSENKVAEVEALGEVASDSDDTKCATSKIMIVKELSWQEVLVLVNMGKDNTGLCNSGNCNSGDCNSGNRNSGDWNSGNRNSGNRNSGDWNSGDCNSGNRNSGNRNSGDWNSGDCNSGDCNSGNRNSGDWNSGNRNSGNRNSGDWNSGDCNSGDWNKTNNSNGVFCTEVQKIKIFDVQTDMILEDWRNSRAARILAWNFETTVWIYSENMTDEEKANNPNHETTGGYLKTFTYKESWRNLWNAITDDEKREIMNVPNFNKDKFEYITGLKLEEL